MSPEGLSGLAGLGPARQLRVLLVVRDATDSERMVDALRGSGIDPDLRVTHDEGGVQPELRDFDPEVVLLGHTLPRASGRRALRLARRHDAMLPVILVSRRLDERRVLRLTRVGLAAFVLEDCMEGLGITVVHAVERARGRRRALRDREALAASERRLRAVVEGSGDAVLISDSSGVIVYCSDAVKTVLGYDPADLVGRHGSVLTGNPEGRTVEGFLRAHAPPSEGEGAMEHRPSRPLQVSLHRADGTTFPAEVSLSSWVEGDERMWASNVRDQSTRRQAAQERKLLARAVEQSRNAVLITDVHGNLQYVNAAFEQMTGYARSEVLGSNPRILKSGAHGVEFYREMWEQLEAGHTYQAEFANRRRDGTEYRQRSVIFPIKDDAGHTISYVGIAEDVTRERRLEEQFRQAQKMEAVGQLAGGIAHDFNNVLTGILGNAELLSDSVADGEARESVDDIIREAARGADLVRRLMSLSREESSAARTLSLGDSLEEAGRTIRRMLPEHIEVQVRHEPGEASPTAKVDEGAFHQAIMNLATNARDAMPEGGVLTLRTIVRGDRVGIQVADSGVGMSAAVAERLFDPFFTTKERGKGTGLGMVMVLQFAERHGGSVEVESAPAQGTRVSILLPRGGGARGPATGGETPTPGESETAEDSTSRKRRGTRRAGTVLLAEDQRQVAEVAKRALERMGLEVIVAVDGAEALSLLRANRDRVDLVITDLVMPRAGGVELYREVSSWPDAPRFLVTSGYAPREMAGAQELLQEVPFLPKPWRLTEFRALVADLLDGAPS